LNGHELAGEQGTTLSISYSDVQGGQAEVMVESSCTLNWGFGNVAYPPYFINQATSDYHLMSYSPCIDIGDPAYDYSKEPYSNQPTINSGINLGAYGNTLEAAIASEDSEGSVGDGLPDEWEELYWPGQIDDYGPGDDPDGDGLINLLEYEGGTNPILMDAPVDIEFTLTDNGSGRLEISYETYNGFRPRSIALSVDLGDATIGQGAVLDHEEAYNCFMDYAHDTGASYDLGQGHPIADDDAAGVPSSGTSEFSINMASFDQGRNQNPGPASASNLVTLELTEGASSSTVVTVGEDTLRNSFGDVVTNLPQTVTVTFE
jgi:hypothetical protein